MTRYEYTVIPAPARGEKTKGAKTGIERFAATLSELLNDMAAEGWDYIRAETLPCEERSGLTGRMTTYHNVLVFRRTLEVLGLQDTPPVATASEPAPPAPQPAAEAQAEPSPTPVAEAPVRTPFSQPMRAISWPAVARASEPPLTAPEPAAISAPRLGPASR